MPVVHLPLDHFKLLKRVYDAFPGRIWCISSETLGVHAWKKHERLQPSVLLHRDNKERLAEIGLPSTEAHPMPGRCLRRPFGADYGTITPHGVLESWTEQLDYFEQDARTPTFKQVCRALVVRMARQWERWQNAYNSYGPMRQKIYGSDARDRLQNYSDEIRQVAESIKAGCPLEAVVSRRDETHSLLVQVFQETVGERPKTADLTPAPKPVSILNNPIPKRASASNNLADLRNGKWVKTLSRLARNGLDREDFIGTVAHEFAKWLYWIELYRQPEDQRRAHDSSPSHGLYPQEEQRFHHPAHQRPSKPRSWPRFLVAWIPRYVFLHLTVKKALPCLPESGEKWESGRYKYPCGWSLVLNGDPDQTVLPASTLHPLLPLVYLLSCVCGWIPHCPSRRRL